MVLIVAVAAGLVAGFLKARLKGEPYQIYELKHLWLILIAVIPQYLAFFLPASRTQIPDQWIPFILITSQLILLVFIWLNRQAPFVWLMGVGLFLNFLVISLNGGWMPIAPETLMSQGVAESTWQIGTRFGFSKDMVLARENTKLWLLSDILTLPQRVPYRVAFSPGDVLISTGVFGFLFFTDRSKNESIQVLKQENKKS